MKKTIVFFSLLSCFYLINLQSMENGGSIEIWDDGEVIIHEGDGFFSDSDDDNESVEGNDAICTQEINTGVLITQNGQFIEQVKKQSRLGNLIQKIKKYGDLILTQKGFIVLISSVVVGYSVAVNCGSDPLNVYPYLTKVIGNYN